jgi:anti-sigma B factor antagonist
MRDHERLNHTVIVPLPAEIDIANAEDVGERLRAAFAPGVTVVIADLGSTTFCDTSGARQLVLAHKRAVASKRVLRAVVPSAGVLRVLAILGVDRVLEIYPGLAEALAAGRAPRPGDDGPR